MGQKINPISLRIQSHNRDFDNSWYSDYFYPQLLSKDIFLKNYFNSFLKLYKLPGTRLNLQYLPKKIRIYTFLCYPKTSRFIRSKIFGVNSGLKKKPKNQKFGRFGFKNTLFQTKFHSKNKMSFIKTNLVAKKLIFENGFALQNNTNRFFSHFNQLELKNTLFDKKKTNFFQNNIQKVAQNLLDFYNVEYQKNNLKNKNLFSNNQKAHQIYLNSFKAHNVILNGFKKVECLKTDTTSKQKLSFEGLVPNTKFLETLTRSNENYKKSIQRYLDTVLNVSSNYIPFKIKQDWQDAGFLADEIVYFLEKRVSFRRIKTRIFQHLSQNSQIRGVRITCSGRVGGKSKKAQRAKTECVKYGQTSLHVFSNQIDFASRTAFTVFGSVGVKVWISYN